MLVAIGLENLPRARSLTSLELAPSLDRQIIWDAGRESRIESGKLMEKRWMLLECLQREVLLILCCLLSS